MYKDTREYKAVYGTLIYAAHTRTTVTYSVIADLMGLPHKGNHTGRQIGLILGEISTEEVQAGRPMLTAIAVSSQGVASQGFYSLATELGLLGDQTPGGWEGFREREMERVYQTWQPASSMTAGSPD